MNTSAAKPEREAERARSRSAGRPSRRRPSRPSPCRAKTFTRNACCTPAPPGVNGTTAATALTPSTSSTFLHRAADVERVEQEPERREAEAASRRTARARPRGSSGGGRAGSSGPGARAPRTPSRARESSAKPTSASDGQHREQEQREARVRRRRSDRSNALSFEKSGGLGNTPWVNAKVRMKTPIDASKTELDEERRADRRSSSSSGSTSCVRKSLMTSPPRAGTTLLKPYAGDVGAPDAPNWMRSAGIGGAQDVEERPRAQRQVDAEEQQRRAPARPSGRRRGCEKNLPTASKKESPSEHVGDHASARARRRRAHGGSASEAATRSAASSTTPSSDGTPMTSIPAARAAATPVGESSSADAARRVGAQSAGPPRGRCRAPAWGARPRRRRPGRAEARRAARRRPSVRSTNARVEFDARPTGMPASRSASSSSTAPGIGSTPVSGLLHHQLVELGHQRLRPRPGRPSMASSFAAATGATCRAASACGPS